MKANELSIGWAMQQKDPAAAVDRVFANMRRYAAQHLAQARNAAAALMPTIVLALQGTLCVAFCFALMFLAAIIGG